jgi:hypothetical protein
MSITESAEIETTVAMTAKDALATFESAGKAAKGFRSAGRSLGESFSLSANIGAHLRCRPFIRGQAFPWL